MSHPVKLEYGNYYHIYNRGNNGENVFTEEQNYHYFLKLYIRHIEPAADTYAYCLLPNHFHLLIRTKTVDEQERYHQAKQERFSKTFLVFKPKTPSQAFANLFNAYTKAFNKLYQRTGSLFEKPFERIHVTDDVHFTHLITYIHQNPQKHGLISDFRDWHFSSYHAILSDKATRLERQIVLKWFDDATGFKQHHDDITILSDIVPLTLEL